MNLHHFGSVQNSPGPKTKEELERNYIKNKKRERKTRTHLKFQSAEVAEEPEPKMKRNQNGVKK